ncbi:MAG: hypothetical protein HZA94_03510 [Candidatus Vogelbacteria bacterium]|nr:hypothetical protein [Candidatus Vogelbacteria bacterium]
MTKVYIGRLEDNIPIVPLLYPNMGESRWGGRIWLDRAFITLREPIVHIVDRIDDADYILLPHNYFYYKNKECQLSSLVKLAEKYGKKIIVFAYGDSDQNIFVKHSLVFRTSQYRFKQGPNEIIMPAYIEDLGETICPGLRIKGKFPIVGFCGWASFKTIGQKIKYVIKNVIIDISLGIKKKVFKQGIYFRKRAIKVLTNSLVVRANFIIRNSYSAHKETLGLDKAKARSDFINNIIESDLYLAIKGDGNYSNRFYEILSLSRVPVLVDTQSILPLEDVINYEEFILRVPYQDIDKLDKTIFNFYNSLDNNKFAEMQKKARSTFEKYLRIDSFFKYYFENPERLSSFAER